MKHVLSLASQSAKQSFTTPMILLYGLLIALLSIPDIITGIIATELSSVYTMLSFFIIPVFIIPLYVLISKHPLENPYTKTIKQQYTTVISGDFLSLFFRLTVFTATALLNAIIVFFLTLAILPNPTGSSGINPEATIPIIVAGVSMALVTLVGIITYVYVVFMIQFYRAEIILSHNSVIEAFINSYELVTQNTGQTLVFFSIKVLVVGITYSVLIFVWQTQTGLVAPTTIGEVLHVFTVSILILGLQQAYNNTFTVQFYEYITANQSVTQESE